VKGAELESIQGASKLLFSPTLSHLVIAGMDGIIYVYDLDSQTILYRLVVENEAKPISHWVKLAISSDGEWLVAGDTTKKLYVFNLERGVQVHVLPTYALATSIQFIPSSTDLVITTISNEIYIMDVVKNRLTEWSRIHSHNLPKKFTCRQESILGVTFPQPGFIMLWGASYTLAVDLSAPVPTTPKWEKTRDAAGEKEEGHDSSYTWGLNHRFQSLMFCESSPESRELFLVERPVLQVLAELPDAWKKRKFGS
jgi:WD40 repeat protein